MLVEASDNLSEGQQAFFDWINQKASYLCPLFDIDKSIYIVEKVDHYLSVASRGEKIMAQFFLMVWRRDNQFEFDLLEAVAHLDKDNLTIITDWIGDPIWP